MIKVIKNGTVITMNEKKEIMKCDIVISDDEIIEIVSDYKGYYDELIDASGNIVMPGLINTHTHLGMSIFRNTNDGLNLMDWLNKKIWPIEENMTEEDIILANKLSCIESIKTGTTTVNDMYFGIKGLEGIKDSKIRCVYTKACSGENFEKLKEYEEMIKTNNSDLITFSVSPHSLYTCSSELLKLCSNLAIKYNLPIHIHFCENEDEVKQIEDKFGMKPVDVLEKLGYLDHKLILAHATFIDGFEKLKRENIFIAHNIVSNLNLGCGFMPLINYYNAGLNISLGTDGAGSGLTLDMFNTMSISSLVAKGLSKDPTFNAYNILEMATINGAKCLGLDEKVGSIEVGKKADIIILDVNNIESYPINNLINHIVHNIKPNNVITSLINGEVVMKNRKLTLLDEENLKSEIQNVINRLNLEE